MRGLTLISLLLSTTTTLTHALPQWSDSTNAAWSDSPNSWSNPTDSWPTSTPCTTSTTTTPCTDDWQSWTPSPTPSTTTTTSCTTSTTGSPVWPTTYIRPTGASSGFLHSTKSSTVLASGWAPKPTPTPSVVPFTGSGADALLCGRAAGLALVGAAAVGLVLGA